MSAQIQGMALVSAPPKGGDPKLRRLPRLDRMALAAAQQALSGEPAATSSGLGLVLGTSYGGLTATAEFLEGLSTRGYPFGSPTAFHQSVHHSAAGQLSIALGIHGPSLTVSARELSGEAALRAGMDLLEIGRAERVLVVAADERVPVLDAGYRAFGVLDRFAVSEGAAAMLLSVQPKGGDGGVQVERCSLTAHPCELLRFPSGEQLGPLLRSALEADRSIGRVSLAAPMASVQSMERDLVETTAPHLQLDSDGAQFGFHGSAGLMRCVAAAARLLKLGAAGDACLVHGIALGGGQAVSVLRRC